MPRALPLAIVDQRREPLGSRRFYARIAVWLWLAVGLNVSAQICHAAEDAQLSTSQARALADFHKSDFAAQQRWLEVLLSERLPRAAKIALSPSELAEVSSYHQQILARIRNGKSLSDHGLAKLLKQTESLEAQAIQRLSNDYGQATAQAFPLDPHQVELRLEAWLSVKTAWELAGADPELQPRLIEWLSEATRRIAQGQTYRLPARPRFGLLATLQTPKARVEPKFAAEKSFVAEQGSSRIDSLPITPRIASVAPRPTLAIAAAPGPMLTASAPRRGHDQLSASRNLGALLLAINATTAPPPSLPAPAQTPADRLASLPKPARPVPPQTPPVTPAAPAPRAIAYGIDVGELNDRVTGYKVALGGLKGKLHEKGDWSQPRLAALVDELAELITRRGDLLLYVRLISEEASATTTLESPAPMVSLASGKISSTRQRIEALPAEATGVAERQALASLGQLSQRLASLVAELQQQDR